MLSKIRWPQNRSRVECGIGPQVKKAGQGDTADQRDDSKGDLMSDQVKEKRKGEEQKRTLED
jgi:hypothetical protein